MKPKMLPGAAQLVPKIEGVKKGKGKIGFLIVSSSFLFLPYFCLF
jgi:hypothetical protein